MKTDEELRQIALDMHLGKIFSDRHCPTPDMIRSVFMILAFMEEAQIKELQERNIDFFYEYVSEAGPMAVNGMPTFFSVRMLNKGETVKMFEYYKKFKEAQDSVKA